MVGGGCAVGCGGDDLPDGFGADIAYGVDPGKAGAGGFVGDNIATFIQRNLSPE
jgi:hypothetical protein